MMHREVVGEIPKGKYVDHINGCALDNREQNIRICTHQQNTFNRKRQSNNTSGFAGVYWSKQNKKWAAKIKHNGKSRHLGNYNKAEDAAKAYDIEALKLRGEYARLNFPKTERSVPCLT